MSTLDFDCCCQLFAQAAQFLHTSLPKLMLGQATKTCPSLMCWGKPPNLSASVGKQSRHLDKRIINLAKKMQLSCQRFLIIGFCRFRIHNVCALRSVLQVSLPWMNANECQHQAMENLEMSFRIIQIENRGNVPSKKNQRNMQETSKTLPTHNANQNIFPKKQLEKSNFVWNKSPLSGLPSVFLMNGFFSSVASAVE